MSRPHTPGGTRGQHPRLSLVLALAICASLAIPVNATEVHKRRADRQSADGLTSEAARLYAYNKQNPRPYAAPPPTPLKPPKSLRRPPGDLARRRQHRQASTLLSPQVLVGLAAMIALIVGTQWLIAVIRLPAILVAVILGLLAGPVGGVIDTDALFGNLLLPLVSLSLAVILYEESSSVRFAELRSMRNQLVSLIGIGLLVASVIGSGAAYLVLDFALPVALLLGIAVALTGPTTGMSRIQPDPRHGAFRTLLEREGVLLDLVGTALVVFVFQGTLFGTTSYGPDALIVTVNTLWIGAVAGLVAAAATGVLLRPEWVPGSLRGPVSLALVTTAFTGAEMLQPSSGFLAVIVMGLTLANWNREGTSFDAQHGHHLRPLLAVGLLIVVTARLQSTDIAEIDAASILFVGVVMIARPLAVGLSTLGAAWSWRERLLFACMAPRGVMTAGLSTLFGLRLAEAGLLQAGGIAPLALLVVLATAGLDAVAAPLLQRSLRPAPAGSQQRLPSAP